MVRKTEYFIFGILSRLYFEIFYTARFLKSIAKLASNAQLKGNILVTTLSFLVATPLVEIVILLATCTLSRYL